MTTRTQQETDDSSLLDVPYPLTDEQIRSLHEDSWALLPGLLSAADVALVRDGLLGSDPVAMFSGPGDKVVDPKNMLKHEGVSWVNPDIKGVSVSRRLCSAAVGLMKRPEALFVHDISFFKPVGAKQTDWHQDYSFWPFDRRGVVSLWIALVDIDEEMGPLRYMKGSHHEGPLGYRDYDGYPQLADMRVVAGRALKAGDAQAHWDLTMHGTAPNQGTRRREAVAFRYHRTDVLYTGLAHTHYDAFNLKNGDSYAESGHFPKVGIDGLI